MLNLFSAKYNFVESSRWRFEIPNAIVWKDNSIAEGKNYEPVRDWIVEKKPTYAKRVEGDSDMMITFSGHHRLSENSIKSAFLFQVESLKWEKSSIRKSFGTTNISTWFLIVEVYSTWTQKYLKFQKKWNGFKLTSKINDSSSLVASNIQVLPCHKLQVHWD